MVKIGAQSRYVIKPPDANQGKNNSRPSAGRRSGNEIR
jgi:hypothetical protein